MFNKDQNPQDEYRKDQELANRQTVNGIEEFERVFMALELQDGRASLREQHRHMQPLPEHIRLPSVAELLPGRLEYMAQGPFQPGLQNDQAPLQHRTRQPDPTDHHSGHQFLFRPEDIVVAGHEEVVVSAIQSLGDLENQPVYQELYNHPHLEGTGTRQEPQHMNFSEPVWPEPMSSERTASQYELGMDDVRRSWSAPEVQEDQPRVLIPVGNIVPTNHQGSSNEQFISDAENIPSEQALSVADYFGVKYRKHKARKNLTINSEKKETASQELGEPVEEKNDKLPRWKHNVQGPRFNMWDTLDQQKKAKHQRKVVIRAPVPYARQRREEERERHFQLLQERKEWIEPQVLRCSNIDLFPEMKAKWDAQRK